MVPEGVPINQPLFDKIRALPKGERPLPETYLPPEYIEAQFGEGGSRIVTKETYLKRGIGKPDEIKSEFISTNKDINTIIDNAKGDINIICNELGIPFENLGQGSLVRIEFIPTSKYCPKLPSGNEWGANEMWLPGGKLPTGKLESVISTENMVKDVDYIVKDLITGEIL